MTRLGRLFLSLDDREPDQLREFDAPDLATVCAELRQLADDLEVWHLFHKAGLDGGTADP